MKKNSRQYVYFHWSGNLYGLLLLCFALGRALQIFTQLLKVSMTILHRINIKIIIYFDDMLLIGYSLEEILMSRNTAISLLQHLGFAKNWKKFMLTPLQEVKSLVLIISFATLELSLNKTDIQKVVSKCENLLNKPQTLILEQTKLIDLFESTIQAVLPATLNRHFLQMQQISSLLERISYLDKIVLNENLKVKLKCWLQI